ncbi:Caskin-2, variant 2 [Balamuthia mandrillaris]
MLADLLCSCVYFLMMATTENMGPTFRRSLILVAKILQALASQAKFEKEAYMLPFTTFTEENIPRVHTFFLSMLEEESDLPRSKTTPLASSCPSLPLRVSSSVDIKYSSTSSWPLRSKLQPLAITTFYTTPQPDSYLREHLLALAQCFQKHFDALRKYCLNEEAADALEQILLDIMEEEEERKQAEADSDESDDAKHARKSKLRKGRTFSMERLLGMKLEPDFEKKKRSLKTVSMDDLRTDKASLPCRPVEHWSKSEVGFWLASIGKPEYVSLFKKQGINGSRLMELTDKNKLMALGVKHLGHRKQISQEIVAQLSTNGEEFVNSESSFAATMSVEEDSWVGRKIIEWTTDDVLQWISYHEDLSEYGKLLKKHKVDGKALTEITIQELTDIGVKKLGHKKKLLKLVRERQQDPEAALYEKEIDIWSYAEVADWLYAVGLGQYHKLFHAHRVTGKLLLLVEEADLVDVGMTQLGHRKKFLKHQQLLKQRLSHRSSPVKTNATV